MITPLFKANQKNAAECYGHGRQYGGKQHAVGVLTFCHNEAPKARPFQTLLWGRMVFANMRILVNCVKRA